MYLQKSEREKPPRGGTNQHALFRKPADVDVHTHPQALPNAPFSHEKVGIIHDVEREIGQCAE